MFAHRLIVLGVLGLTLIGGGTVQAQTDLYFWTGNAPWDYTTADWSTNSTGPYTSTWSDGSDAYFPGSNATASVSSTIASVDSITFLGSNYTIGGGSLNLTGPGGDVTVSGSSATISSPLIGTGGLTKVGPGTLYLNGMNTYAGNTIVSGGSLVLNGPFALQDSTLDYSGYGGTLSLGSGYSDYYLGGLMGTQNLNLGGPQLFTVGINNQSTTYSGALSNANTFIKAGTGTLTLGGANTYSGLTQIKGGAIALANANALQNSTLDYQGYGGSLSFGSLTSAVLGGLQGSQALSLTNANSQPVAASIGNNGNSTTYSGILQGQRAPLGSFGNIG
jgi:autotransporter-associated beta strand protein